MNKIIGIYKITSPSGKIYIGESVNIEKRIARYKSYNCKQQYHLYNSLKKYGAEEHIFEIIEVCEIDELKCRERYWQEFYEVLDKEKGLNLRLTECGEKKRINSQYSIDKQKKTSQERKVSVGENNSMYGKKHKQSTKEKISKANKGRHKGEKNPCYGKFGKDHPAFGNVPSEETRKLISERQMFGKNHASKIVIDLETGVFYESASELAHIFNINKYTLRSKLNGHLRNNTNFKYC